MATRAPGIDWSADWMLGFRIWVEKSGRPVLGKGRVELLAAIDRTHSISAAAREIGMSYRHAWMMVQEINERAGTPLVAAAVGGKRGGGAQLTPCGRQAVVFFQRLQARFAACAAEALREVASAAPELPTEPSATAPRSRTARRPKPGPKRTTRTT